MSGCESEKIIKIGLLYVKLCLYKENTHFFWPTLYIGLGLLAQTDNGLANSGILREGEENET